MLSSAIKNEIRNHYEGDKKLSFETGKKLVELVYQFEDEQLLSPQYPHRGRYNYRILANVKKFDLVKLVGTLSVKGKTTLPILFSEVMSWTIDREAFHNGKMIGEQGIGKRPIKGRYTIMLECHANDGEFIFNPTTLPQAVGAEAFADEMEVVSVGNVRDVKVRHLKNDGEMSYDEILEILEN